MNRWLAILLLCVLARFANAADSAEPHRFLLVVDSSQSMTSRKAALLRTIRGLIGSGFQSQGRVGDALEIWTFATGARTNVFPTQQWDPRGAAYFAEMAAVFLEEEKFLGRTRFSAVADDLNAWVSRQADALIFLITDGEDPVQGIPHDIEINSYISPRRSRARSARRVFLVSLLVRAGRVTEWRAHDGIGKLELPLLPVREIPKPPAAATNVVAVSVVTTPPPEPEPPPVVEFPPGAKVIAPELAPEITPVEAAVPEPGPQASPQAPVAAPTAQAETPAPTNAPSPPADEIIPPPTPVKIEVPPVAAATNFQDPPEAQPVAVLAPVWRNPGYFLLGGAVFLALITIFVLLRPRRRPDRASLISKSLSDQ